MSDSEHKGAPRDRNDLDLSAAVTTGRAFTADDLAFINRMTTTGQVLPSVAHELNNSLQIIAGMVEILGLRGQLPDETADKVQKIGVQAGKAAGLLRDLVAFARRDGALRKIDLHAAVERATGLRRYYLSRGRVTVQVTARQEGPLVARADSQSVVQVLVNLILNAEEALAARDQREIRVDLWRADGFVHCAISDSGEGFSADVLAQASTPFFTTKAIGAAGLGLAVAQRLVEQDGGRLEVEGPAPARVHVAWLASEG
jgi:C4-dicarboxylate-specific signal transduction histidine kinase